jgi:SAM-dependent methyltransferase|eukprot:COSAG06_NODE_5020_length_3786_cov_156.246813_4_plen_266_part_00
MAAAQYVQKHRLAQTIERGLTEALKSQPENPYEALAAWFKDVPAAPAADDDHDREGAYSLDTPAAHVEYYDKWASTYDSDFAEQEGYSYPENLSAHYLSIAEPGDTPVADIGAGTGLAGIGFKDSETEVDALDISPGMLKQAAAKGVYRSTVVADLTDAKALPNKALYGGLISSGTFTFGHLGPDELETSLLLARPNALCVIGVNALHYEKEGFSKKMAALEAAGCISKPEIVTVPIYATPTPQQVASAGKDANLLCFRLLKPPT